MPGSKVWSVVKANAYGHGLELAYTGLQATDGFALLDMQEAQKLRQLGWTGPILLLEGLFTQDDIFAAVDARCDLVVHDFNQVGWLESIVESKAKLAYLPKIYLKLNSGMNRLGFSPAEYRQMYHRLHVLGYEMAHMTHFANADYVDRSPSVDEQYDLFVQTIDQLKGETCLPNSAAIMWHHHLINSDWVRPGIMLYGASPSGSYEDIQQANLQPTMSLRSQIIATQTVEAGQGIGYGSRYKTDVTIRIGVVACGYADGYPRHAPDGTPVWVSAETGLAAGQVCRMVGQVSMDMLTVDITDMPQAQVGTPVELWGQYLPVDEVAKPAGTIGYELLCAVAPRVPRKLSD